MLEDHEIAELEDLVQFTNPHWDPETGRHLRVSRNAHFALVKMLELAKRLQSEEFLAQLAATIATSASAVLEMRGLQATIGDASKVVDYVADSFPLARSDRALVREIGRNAAQCVNELINGEGS